MVLCSNFPQPELNGFEELVEQREEVKVTPTSRNYSTDFEELDHKKCRDLVKEGGQARNYLTNIDKYRLFWPFMV